MMLRLKQKDMTATIDFTEVIELKNFKVLGYTTDFNKCDCCGRENLKGTVSILNLDCDIVSHYGTSCAAAANKYDTLEAVAKAKKDIDSAVRHHRELTKSARFFAWRYLRRKYGNDAAETLPKEVSLPIVEDFEKWYTMPGQKKAHPLFNR